VGDAIGLAASRVPVVVDDHALATSENGDSGECLRLDVEEVRDGRRTELHIGQGDDRDFEVSSEPEWVKRISHAQAEFTTDLRREGIVNLFGLARLGDRSVRG
jgi:hypothetical protein